MGNRHLIKRLGTICVMLLFAVCTMFAETVSIGTAKELETFRDRVNAGETTLNGTLTADINLNGDSNNRWDPISMDSRNRYAGTFDGAGHIVKGLYIDRPIDYVGFFGAVGPNAIIKNLTIEGDILGGVSTFALGGIVATLDSSNTGKGLFNCINRCYILNKGFYAGGIVGFLGGRVSNCINIGQVNSLRYEAGGITGRMGGNATIDNCYNYGDVTCEAGEAGGICGKVYQDSQISNCFSSSRGIQSIGSNPRAGAIAGVASTTAKITNCHYSSATVVKEGATTSGLAVVSTVGIRYIGGMEDTNPSLTEDKAGVTMGHDATTLASGKVARLLNGGNTTTEASDGAWGQTLLTDATPVLMTADKSNRVYSMTFKDNNTIIWAKYYNSATFPDNDKTLVDGYFTIKDADEMYAFRDIVNSVKADLNGKLTANIDLAGSNTNQWTPIGSESQPYTGIFDGAGFTVSGIYINNSKSYYQGFFGYVKGSGACVKNLTVAGEITGKYYVAGIASYVTGKIENCVNKCKVNGFSSVGGITGETFIGSIILNCFNNGDIMGEAESIGGIVGYLGETTLSGCVNSGTVTGLRTSNGGIVGTSRSHGRITDCLNNGDVIGAGSTGGICGYIFSGRITNCFSDAKSITATQGKSGNFTFPARAGAIVGANDNNTINNCHYSATVTVKEGVTTANLAVVHTVGVRYKGKEEVAEDDNRLTTDEAGVTMGHDATTLATGKVARLLNGGNTTTEAADGAWGQTLLTDATPVLMTADKSNRVYSMTFKDNNTIIWAKYYNSATFPDNDKTLVDGYFTIKDADEMHAFRDIVNSGKTGLNGKLTANIDLAGSDTNQWDRIGSESQRYAGIFDGAGFKVSSIYINNSKSNYQGFFGFVQGNEACIKNLTLSGEITGNSYSGGIVGCIGDTKNGGSILNCVNECNISGEFAVGGIAGDVSSKKVTIQDCTNFGKISGSMHSIGGIVGGTNGYMSRCVNRGEVSGNLTEVGGIAGYLYTTGSISDCLNHGNVIGAGATGGICGYSYPNNSIINCFSDAKSITATQGKDGNTFPARAGAIVGANNGGTITNCHYSIATVVKEGVATADLAVVRTVGVRYKGVDYAAEDDNRLTTDEAGVTMGHDATTLATGKVARLLNGGNTTEAADGTWGQTLPTDLTPAFMLEDKSNRVYGWVIKDNNTTIWAKYNNSATAPDIEKTLVDGYFTIKDADEMHLFRDIVNSGKADLNGVLTANIDLAGSDTNQWTPIGFFSPTDQNRYAGIFDGAGFKVSGIYINKPESDNQGFFGLADACIKNLTLSGEITGRYSVGGIVGLIGVTVSNILNCVNECNISGMGNVGGIAGCSDYSSNISQCVNHGKITGTIASIGGIVGNNAKSITDCLNHGDVIGAGPTGGICGYLFRGRIINCFSDAKNITATQGKGGNTFPARAGAIVGVKNVFDDIAVTNCHYSTATVVKEGVATANLAVVPTVGVRYKGNYADPASNPGLTEDEAGVTMGHDAAKLATGKVARLLNGGNTTTEAADGVWGQTLPTDLTPAFMLADKSNKVFSISIGGTDKGYYNNSQFADIALNPNEILEIDAQPMDALQENWIYRNADGEYVGEVITLDNMHPYTCTQGFTASDVTFKYTPRSRYKKNGGGMETLCLPFAGTMHDSKNGESLHLITRDFATTKGNMLVMAFDNVNNESTLDKVALKYTDNGDYHFKAGEPYVFAIVDSNDFPYHKPANEAFYIIPKTNQDGKVEFVGAPVDVVDADGNSMRGTFSGLNVTRAYLPATDTDKTLVKAETLAVERSTEAAIAPFTAYFTPTDGQVSAPETIAIVGDKLPTGVEDATANRYNGVTVYGYNGTLVIESENDVELPLYNTAGTLLRVIRATSGKTVINDLPKGLYITASKKIAL